jgi:hypothetical protein
MTEIVTTVEAPDAVALTTRAQQALDFARDIVIDSDPMLQVAAGELQTIKSKAKTLEEQRVAITKPLLEAKRRVDDLFRKPLEYLAEAEGVLKSAINGYQRRIEDEKRRERAAAEEAARKEAKRLAELAAKQAAAGREEKAAETRARAEAVQMAPSPVVEAPKVAGISTRKKYSVVVVDDEQARAFVQSNPAFRYLLVWDQAGLNKLAGAQREAFSIPGCKLVVEDVIAARAA